MLGSIKSSYIVKRFCFFVCFLLIQFTFITIVGLFKLLTTIEFTEIIIIHIVYSVLPILFMFSFYEYV